MVITAGRKQRRKLCALILAPTRELAFQVSSHLRECLNSINDFVATEGTGPPQKTKGKRKEKSTAKPPPPVSVAAVVGGMSAHKQRRILDRGVDILVATPGRLWDIMEEVSHVIICKRNLLISRVENDALSSDIKSLRFLVIDEADRMIEAGHFAELDNILRLAARRFRLVGFLLIIINPHNSNSSSVMANSQKKSMMAVMLTMTKLIRAPISRSKCRPSYSQPHSAKIYNEISESGLNRNLARTRTSQLVP